MSSQPPQQTRPSIPQTSEEMEGRIRHLEQERFNLDSQITTLRAQLHTYRSARFYVAIRRNPAEKAAIYALSNDDEMRPTVEVFSLFLQKENAVIVWPQEDPQSSVRISANAELEIGIFMRGDGMVPYIIRAFTSHNDAEKWSQAST